MDTYLRSWNILSAWLRGEQIFHPAQLTYQACQDFFTRQLQVYRGSSVRLQKALLSLVVKEAMRRGYTLHNPVALVRIQWAPPRQKLEITEAHLERILFELKACPQWMQDSFAVALHTGCRWGETCFDVRADYQEDRRLLTFPRPKGGVSRAYTVPVNDHLHALIMDWRGRGRQWSVECPETQPAWRWSAFFKDIGLGQYCFHCLRVTYVSRGARAGVPENVMRMLVNHAGPTVHRIYQRYEPTQLQQAVAAIQAFSEAQWLKCAPPAKAEPAPQ